MRKPRNIHVAPQGAGKSPPRPHFRCQQLAGTPPSKVAVIREEFLRLTGNPHIAVVLNQLLYWTERLPDLEKLLKEEFTHPQKSSPSPIYGWFYKSSDQLNKETLLCLSRYTIRGYLRYLSENGWITERLNPEYKWDKTTQYRVNLGQLCKDLRALGYTLPAFSFVDHQHQEASDSRLLKNAPSKENSATLECEESHPSRVENPPFISLTEITSETTNRDHTKRAPADKIVSKEEKSDSPSSTPPSYPANAMLKLWEEHVGQGPLFLTDKRQFQLEDVLKRHFQNDLSPWNSLCQRIKASPFLMGEGGRRWRVSLDWILEEANLLKVLEGNFDDPTFRGEKPVSINQCKDEIGPQILLESIEDPTWKRWCTALIQSQDVENNRLSLFILKDMARAMFKEFDGRLVWIECEDLHALNRVEELRLKLLPILQVTYPDARNIRTTLTPNPQTTERNNP